MAFRIDVGGKQIEDWIGDLKALQPQAKRALHRSVRKTTVWAARQAARDIAKRTRVPLKALTQGGSTGRGRRVRTRVPKNNDLYGSVWVGYNPFKAAYAGKLRQLRAGAAAGVHRFPGAFLAATRSGHVGVFRRATNARRRRAGNLWGITTLPIDDQTIDLQVSREVLEEIGRGARVRIRDAVFEELNYEVNVKR